MVIFLISMAFFGAFDVIDLVKKNNKKMLIIYLALTAIAAVMGFLFFNNVITESLASILHPYVHPIVNDIGGQ